MRPPACCIYGDPDFPNGKAGINKRWTNFSPRVGLAWDVTGDGRTSVRASWAYQYRLRERAVARGLLCGGALGQFHDGYRRGARESVGDLPGRQSVPGANRSGRSVRPVYQLPGDAGGRADAPSSRRGTSPSSGNSVPTGRCRRATSARGRRTSGRSGPVTPPSIFRAVPVRFRASVPTRVPAAANTNQRRQLSLENPAEGQYIGRCRSSTTARPRAMTVCCSPVSVVSPAASRCRRTTPCPNVRRLLGLHFDGSPADKRTLIPTTATGPRAVQHGPPPRGQFDRGGGDPGVHRHRHACCCRGGGSRAFTGGRRVPR